MPELNTRLNLALSLQPPSPPCSSKDPFAPTPDLSNKSPISIIYLGNSMLERLKTTGQSTLLHHLPQCWNAGCGGDKNENVIYRLDQGLYDILSTEQKKKEVEGENSKFNIKLWILASGTNNLHPKRGFKDTDVSSWKMLVESCLKIAPESKVLACDVFYRKDVPDEVVERCNGLLKDVVGEVNRELEEAVDDRSRSVEWVQARHLITKEMLVDHVHLNEEGYRVWDEVLWPYVAGEGFEVEE